MKIYDFLRIQNRDILFMTSPKVKISNLKKKTLKILYTKYFRVFRELFEFFSSISSRVTICLTRLVNISSRAHSSRVLTESSLSSSRVVSSH